MPLTVNVTAVAAFVFLVGLSVLSTIRDEYVDQIHQPLDNSRLLYISYDPTMNIREPHKTDTASLGSQLDIFIVAAK